IDPETSWLTAICSHGGFVVITARGLPCDDVTDGSSLKICREKFGGGKTSFGGFGCGATVMLLPGITACVPGLTWFWPPAFTLMFWLLNARSSGAPMWMSETELTTGARSSSVLPRVSSTSVSEPLEPASSVEVPRDSDGLTPG